MYKIITRSDGSMTVFEIKTETPIRDFAKYKQAKKFMKFLSSGGGFNGWTPSFVLKSVVK